VLGIPNDGLHIHLVHNEVCVCVCVCVWYSTSESFTGRTSRKIAKVQHRHPSHEGEGT
jgi:hypothetical protein